MKLPADTGRGVCAAMSFEPLVRYGVAAPVVMPVPGRAYLTGLGLDPLLSATTMTVPSALR